MLFGTIVLGLVLAHIACQSVRLATGDSYLMGLVPLFNVGTERNLPTFYSSFAMLFSAGLLGLIAFAVRGGARSTMFYWMGLAAVFVLLSLDEMLVLHEKLIEPVRAALDTSGVFHYAWVIPYGIFVLLFAALYVRFLARLPRRTATLFVVAGGMFVAGAVGVEMIGGHWFVTHGRENVMYVVLQTLEETLEMTGIVVFIYALTEYLERTLDLRLRFTSA
jgi:hypothetical protein